MSVRSVSVANSYPSSRPLSPPQDHLNEGPPPEMPNNEQEFLEFFVKILIEELENTEQVDPVPYLIQQMWCECQTMSQQNEEIQSQLEDEGASVFYGSSADTLSKEIISLLEMFESNIPYMKRWYLSRIGENSKVERQHKDRLSRLTLPINHSPLLVKLFKKCRECCLLHRHHRQLKAKAAWSREGRMPSSTQNGLEECQADMIKLQHFVEYILEIPAQLGPESLSKLIPCLEGMCTEISEQNEKIRAQSEDDGISVCPEPSVDFVSEKITRLLEMFESNIPYMKRWYLLQIGEDSEAGREHRKRVSRLSLTVLPPQFSLIDAFNLRQRYCLLQKDKRQLLEHIAPTCECHKNDRPTNIQNHTPRQPVFV